jgi:chromosome segregation ATPase
MVAENSALQAQVQTASNSAALNAVVEASQKSFREAEKNLRTVVERSFETSAVREQNATLKGQLAKAQGECSTLRSELSEANSKAAAVDVILETTTASLQSAENALMKSREQSTQLADIKHDNDDLAHQLQAAVARCEACERAHAHQEQETRAAQEEASRLRCREAELRQQTVAAATASQQEIATLRQRVERMETAGSEVNAVLDVTKASLEQAERSLLSSKQQSSSLQAEMQALKAALDQAENERDELRKDLRTADSSRQQAQHKLTAANAASSRDRAELQQLRQHIARMPEKPQPIVPDVDEHSDKGLMEQELSLLRIRVDSMDQVLRLQEQELSSHDGLLSDAAKQSASEQLLRNWRDKVLSLLVQQKSTDIVHRQELAASERHEHQLRDELARMRTKIEILTQGEVNLKAEADRARNKQQHAEDMLQKAISVRDEMANTADGERQQLGQLALQVRTKYDEMKVLEQRLQTSAARLQEYSTRVEAAVGRLGVAQEEVARSLEHRKQGMERLSVELSVGKSETEIAQNRLADAEDRAKELARALENAQNLARVAQDESSAAEQTAATQVAELNESIASKVE